MRNVRLDILRVLAIIECIIAHALIADHPDKTEYAWLMIFVPDTAAVFFMASGALILDRRELPTWRYVWHRIASFLPEFIVFSTLYVCLDCLYGFNENYPPVAERLFFMFVTPTWGPGWFVLALIGVYAVAPMLAAWVRNAGKRQVEIGIAVWLCATCLPMVAPHTLVNIPQSIFGTLFNYAGYLLVGYYLVKWPFDRWTALRKVVFFVLTVGVGLVFGYFAGRSGVKWGYIDGIITGLSVNIVMLSLVQTGIVLLIPERCLKGAVGKVFTFLSVLSLGIYCCHWLVIRYWAIPAGINWITGTLTALAVSIPVAWLMHCARKKLISR